MFIFTQLFSLILQGIRTSLPWIAGFFGASVSNILVSAGVGVVAFGGFNYLTSHFISIAVNSLAGIGDVGTFGADIVQLLGYMWVDKALNLVVSSAVALMALKGVREGVLNRQVWWKPGQKTGGIDA